MIGKLHVAVRLRASLAVHETEVVPNGNVVPDPGVHDTATGVCPPLADGVVNVTAVPLAEVVLVVTAAGQVRLGGSGVAVGGVGGGGVGAVGLLQPIAMPARSATTPNDRVSARAHHQPMGPIFSMPSPPLYYEALTAQIRSNPV